VGANLVAGQSLDSEHEDVLARGLLNNRHVGT
jgi:hypothetical protein